MYKFQFNSCLLLILLSLFIIFLAFKLWFLVLILLIIFTLKNTLYKIVLGQQETQREKEIKYAPEKGEIYKICPCCGINIKYSATKCPNCEKELN